MQNNAKLSDVSALRSFAILSVVLYHSFSPYIAYGAGMIQSPVSPFYMTIFSNFWSFRMPLYIFISGYLFSFLFNKKGKYASLGGLVRNKFERLIIPYIIFSVLIALTYKQFNLDYAQKILEGYQHLWFILMLFESFVVARLLACIKYVNQRLWFQMILLAIFFLISLVFKFRVTRLLAFNYLVGNFFWFWFGYIALLNKEKLFRLLKYKYIITFLAVWVIFCILIELFCPVHTWGYENGFKYDLVKYSSYFFIIISIYLLINKKIKQSLVVPQWVENLNRCSYGIYIFHFWILFYFFIPTCPVYSQVQKLATTHYIIFPTITFVFLFTSSLLITKLLLRYKFGRFLLGNSPSPKPLTVNR